MSLQIWLPLNGDLMNQGLSSAIISGTPVYATTGKIGGKSLNTGMLSITASDAAKILNNKTFSYACWIYVNADTGVTSGCSAFFGRESMSSGGNRQFTLFQYNNVNSLHWSWQNNTVTDSSTFTTGTLPNVFPSRQWTHLAVTYENPVIKFYINGKLKHTVSNAVSNSSSFNYTLPVAVGSASRYLNDVRIYDHCLSEKEVKELAKGLVLHYRLAGPGQENLVKNTYDWKNYSVDGSGQSNIGSYSLKNGIYHIIDSNSNTRFYYNQGEKVPINGTSTYTISIKYKWVSGTDKTFRWQLQGFNGNSQIATIWSSSLSTTVWHGKSGEWQLIECPFNFNNSSVNGLRIYIQDGADYTTYTHEYYLKEMKLEKGSIATPWCPNPADALYSAMGYNNNIEYDCSGYRRNGTKSGNIAWDVNSPRYTTSYKFIPSNRITSTTGMPIGSNTVFTVNFWLYIPSGKTFAQWGDFIGFNGSDIRLETSNTDASRLNWYNYPVGSSGGLTGFNLIKDTWNMITLICDGSKFIQYLNGNLLANTNLLGTAFSTNGSIWIGDTQNMYFNISDLRIYATALSAEDIAELYHSAVIVDNTGKSYAYEYFEAN